MSAGYSDALARDVSNVVNGGISESGGNEGLAGARRGKRVITHCIDEVLNHATVH